MTPAALAARDQAEAKERDWEQSTAAKLRFALALFALVGLYAVAAAYGIVPAAEWSAIGGAK